MILNKPKTVGLGALIIAFVITGTSCYYNKEDILYPEANQPANSCETVPASFKDDILPLVLANCNGSDCHSAGADAFGRPVLTNYAQISSAKDLIHTQAIIQKSMPPTGALPLEESNKLRCWISAGGLNN